VGRCSFELDSKLQEHNLMILIAGAGPAGARAGVPRCCYAGSFCFKTLMLFSRSAASASRRLFSGHDARARAQLAQLGSEDPLDVRGRPRRQGCRLSATQCSRWSSGRPPATAWAAACVCSRIA